MKKQRQRHSSTFKAQIALLAIRGDQSINEIAQTYHIHPNLVVKWKKLLSENAANVFARNRNGEETAQSMVLEQLYRQIGEMTVEMEFLKKRL